MKKVVFVISLVWLFVGAAIWLAGWLPKCAPCKRLGVSILGAWLVFDFLAVAIAFSLGWFS